MDTDQMRNTQVRATLYDIIKSGNAEVVRSFTSQILHGDDVHRQWLLEACEAYINGEPIPKPRDDQGVL